MRAGRLDRRINLERKAVTQSPSGAAIETWTPIGERVLASYWPVRGDERISGVENVATEQVEFRIRWTASLADLNPKDRVVYPAAFPGLSPEDVPGPERIYDILSVHEFGRRDGLLITAARRSDV